MGAWPTLWDVSNTNAGKWADSHVAGRYLHLVLGRLGRPIRLGSVRDHGLQHLPLTTAATPVAVSADGSGATVDATPCLAPLNPALKLQRQVEVEGEEVRISVTLSNRGREALEIGGKR